jgi:hypothetical protein
MKSTDKILQNLSITVNRKIIIYKIFFVLARKSKMLHIIKRYPIFEEVPYLLPVVYTAISEALRSIFFLLGYVSSPNSFPQPLSPEAEKA